MDTLQKNIGDKIIIEGHLNIITEIDTITMRMNYDHLVLREIREYTSPKFSMIFVNKVEDGLIAIGASNTTPIKNWQGILYQIEFEIINYSQSETPRPLVYYPEYEVKLGEIALNGQFNKLGIEIVPVPFDVIVTPGIGDKWLGDDNLKNLKYIRRI